MKKNNGNNGDKISLGRVKISTDEKFIVPDAKSGIDKRILTYYQPKGAIAEQYRTLRTNLKRLNKENHVKAVILTSSIHNEGKTITSVNLAVAMTYEIDRKILLVDCDLRKGYMHMLLGMENNVGMAEYLVSKATLEQIIRKTQIAGLDFISCGAVPVNPSELLGSKKMVEFLNIVKQNYDFIIMDTPPIIPLTDAAVLGEIVDGVVLVVQAGRTKREVVKQSELLLTQADCNILGFVLTNVEYYIPSYYYKYV